MLSIENPAEFFENLEKYKGYFKPLEVKTYPAPAGCIYASPDGSGTAHGLTKEKAVNIQRAVSIVPTGGTIVVLRGTYRITKVITIIKRCTIQGEEGTELPLFTGALIPTTFTPDAIVAEAFSFDQPTVFTDIDEDLIPSSKPWIKYPQHVFIDNVPLEHVGTTTELASNTFYYNPTTKAITIKSDPTGKLIEAIGCERCFQFLSNSVNGCIVRSLAFDKFVLPILSTRPFTIEDCTFTNFSYCGVILQGILPVGRVIRRNKFTWGGCNGIRSTMSTIEGNELSLINTKGYRTNYGAAPIKLISNTAASGFYDPIALPTILRGNYIHHSYAIGIWIDERLKDVLIEKNVIFDSNRNCIQIEISHGGTVRYNILQGLVNLVNTRNAYVHNNTFFAPSKNAVVIYSDGRLPPTDPPPNANQIASLDGWNFESYGHLINNNLMISETVQGKQLFFQFNPGVFKSSLTPTLIHTFDSIKGNVQARINTSNTSYISHRIGTTNITTDYIDAAAFKVTFPTAESKIDSKTVLGTDVNTFFHADGVTPRQILKNPDGTYPGAIQPFNKGAVVLFT